MKIYIDFDRTLFNCNLFLNDLSNLLLKYNISNEMFNEYQIQCKDVGFNPYVIVREIEKDEMIDKHIYDEIKNLVHTTSKYLYSDVIPFFKELKNKNYEIYILSKGNVLYQKEKIVNSKILDYCNDMIITTNFKGNLEIDYENSIFIDDNPNEIKSILEKKTKHIFYIQREDAKFKEFINDKRVTIINDLIKLNI